MVLPINDPAGMVQARNHMAARITRILELSLDIICLITGEDCTVVKKTPAGIVPPLVSGEWSRTLSHITEPRPPSRRLEQKILELTSRITELLSGEVPTRCQDVTGHFSMEKRENLEGHKDLYKEVMMNSDPPGMAEDYTVVKWSGGIVTPRVSGGWSRPPSPITEPPPHSLEQEILEITRMITELLREESDDSRTSGLEIPISVSETDL
ncbi:uncharacterized protein LOC142196228 [Leptodactylus fuscus]|uniref:uncharacterized protein LOC142196228 n=1 Tax=Leptodactylus fuscus TaxID=238119 RepID=UPI003F4EA2EB